MIREANESDSANLAALSLEVWLQTYSMDGIRTESSEHAIATFTTNQFKQLLREAKYKILVFYEAIYLRGYALVNLDSHYESEENGFEIERLYVHKPFQGQGIGRNLLFEIKARYGGCFWLYTWTRNKSIAFYKKFGFKDIGQYNFKLGNDTIENRVLCYNDTQP